MKLEKNVLPSIGYNYAFTQPRHIITDLNNWIQYEKAST